MKVYDVFRKTVEKNERKTNKEEINLKYFFESGITMQQVAKLIDRFSDERM